ncbi:putative Universal stress protein UspA (Modular protein) [Candidatus Nitrospira nitrosa]|uniref:Putative Universal stress protein UspA (Modular protein) n=1 Tax=Candidatus Nitrospira nitrosa TaxID=1742972 RepID=A0A0S4L9A3_9BACT|nr:universal stress protein [Candidatus Nitrospira nitrosa]CUS34085.1 putative Universal stress protein UspA (Modular protein) [Candidatus Nitrospira nitrosa]
MYKTIYIPVDNSDHSNTAVDVGVHLAKTFGSKIVGSHVYAAKMHDKRFKQMEAGLPEEYHDEKELDRQRQIHDSLITRGLQIITDSYLDYVDKKCNEANLPIERRSLEGRNWKVLSEDINTNAYDLVIMGALGVGAVKDSVIGSNTERVIRRVRNSDMLIIKNIQPMTSGKIVVAVDGSPYSFGGLMTGLQLGKALNMPVEAISAFDPYFHYAAFHSISGVLNEEAGKVFRFKEQEKLHEEIIDSGLAKIYQSHLDISREIAQAEQTDVKTTLLDGKAFEKIIQYVRKDVPALLIVGRIGVHSDEDMDVGSNTENLLRSAPCNILVSNRKYVPPIDTQAEYTIAWTEEALRRMEKIPVFARGVAKTAIHRYAIEKGHTIISNTVVDAAVGHILPKGAMDAMRALGGSLDAAGIDRDQMQADQAVTQDLMGPTLSGIMTQIVEEKPKEISASTQAYLDRMAQIYFVCDGCGYIGKGDTPVKCPVCSADGTKFKQVDKKIFEVAATAEGELETDVAYDDVPMQWTKDAKEAIRAVPAGFQRRRAKARIEKTARKLGMTTITLEYAAPMIKEAASEDYTPIFSNKGTGTAPAAEGMLTAANGNGTNGHAENTSPYTWTSDAQARLDRAPEGFMRDCTKALILKHAEKIGATVITIEVANEGIEQAKGYMADAMKTGNLKDMIADLTGKGSA